MPVQIRKAERTDAETLLALIGALADYEHLSPPSPDACERLIRDGWPDTGEPRFTSWLAEIENASGQTEAVGYAISFFTYSSFLALPTLYIEDIFILPDQRRMAAGSALFQRLVEEARARGCGRVEWVVLDWNTSAQQFYQKHGAKHLTDWQCYRLPLT